jgi:hypothetical protein
MSDMITASLVVSNAGGTTPNFTAAITDLGAFLTDVRSRLQPAVYPFVWSAETEKWSLYELEHEPKGITLTITDEDEDLLADGDTITVTIAASEVNVTDPARRTADMYDAMAGGVMYYGIPSRMVFVDSAADLEDLPATYQPGAMAATYGFGQMWQLDGSGEWTPIQAEESAEGGE